MATRFPLGRILATPGALAALGANRQCLTDFLEQHAHGKWGDALSQEDYDSKDWSLENDERLLSAYFLRNGQKLWIITERDRSATTVLLPDEY